MSNNDSAILLEEVSPNGNVLAAAESAYGVVYFYLRGEPDSDFAIKSCWVRNLRAAPDELDMVAMKEGQPPLLRPAGAPSVAMPDFRGDPVNILWMLPITGAERDLAMSQGSEALAKRLASAGHGWIHRDRRSLM